MAGSGSGQARERERGRKIGEQETHRQKKTRGRVSWKKKERSALDWKRSSCMGFRHSHPLAPSAGALAVFHKKAQIDTGD